MAYADDLAAALACKEALLRLPAIFNAWHQAIGMRLNHSKTTLIPLDRFIHADGAPMDRATKYIASLASPCNTARVRRHVTYLGVLIGTDATEHMWTGPLNKWQQRARQLAACGVAQDATLREYRSRALPCLSYLSQFVRLAAQNSTDGAEALRNYASLSILRMPRSGFTLRTPTSSSPAGGRILSCRCHPGGRPAPTSLVEMCHKALTGTR